MKYTNTLYFITAVLILQHDMVKPTSAPVHKCCCLPRTKSLGSQDLSRSHPGHSAMHHVGWVFCPLRPGNQALRSYLMRLVHRVWGIKAIRTWGRISGSNLFWQRVPMPRRDPPKVAWAQQVLLAGIYQSLVEIET